MKKFYVLLMSAAIAVMFTGCTAMETVAANNKDKSVNITQETWGGKLVAEMVSIGSSVLPNLTLSFGKINTGYSAIPKDTNPELIKAQAELVKAGNSAVSATAVGMVQTK